MSKLIKKISIENLLFVIFLLFISDPSLAQGNREDTIKSISDDLAQINQQIVKFNNIRQYTMNKRVEVRGEAKYEFLVDDIYHGLVKEMANIEDKYRNNSYVTIKGFSINIGISPSVTLDFEFNDKKN